MIVFPWMWVSATDQEKEGIWLDYYTGERLENYTLPWYPGDDARSGDTYNCVMYYPDTPPDIAWGEEDCVSYNKACPCQYSRQPILLLRGAYPYNQFDTIYTPNQLASTPSDQILLGQQ